MRPSHQIAWFLQRVMEADDFLFWLTLCWATLVVIVELVLWWYREHAVA